MRSLIIVLALVLVSLGACSVRTETVLDNSTVTTTATTVVTVTPPPQPATTTTVTTVPPAALTRTKTVTVTRTGSTQLERAGAWDYTSTLATGIPGFDLDDYSSNASTVNIARIQGTDYMVLILHPSGENRENSLILVYDVSDPVSPKFVSSVVHPEGAGVRCIVNDLDVKDGILYGGLFGDKGIWIVDITNPAKPMDLGIMPVAGIEDVYAVGNYVYASSMSDVIVISDVSDIRNIKEVSWISLGTGECETAVSGNLLFAGMKGVIWIYDISTPASPVRVGTCGLAVTSDITTTLEWVNMAQYWKTWATIQDIQASGNYVYVAFGAGGVRVIDISNPSSPREVNTISLGGFAIALTLKDNLLYATKADYEVRKKELAVVDVASPENPILIGKILTGASFNISGIVYASYWIRPQVIGDFIYIAGNKSLEIFVLE